MNNYHEIQNQWTINNQINYPVLFNWTVEMMKEGIAKGEKVMK